MAKTGELPVASVDHRGELHEERADHRRPVATDREAGGPHQGGQKADHGNLRGRDPCAREPRRNRHGQPPVEMRRDIPVCARLPEGLEQAAARFPEGLWGVDIDPGLSRDVDGLHLSIVGQRLDPITEAVSAPLLRVLERVKKRRGRQEHARVHGVPGPQLLANTADPSLTNKDFHRVV